MAKVFIEESTLTAIGDAIRSKTSTTAKLSPTAMPAKIESIETGGGGGGYVPTDTELTLNGDMTMAFAENKFNWVIREYGSRMYMSSCYPLTQMFYNCHLLTEIPFTLRYSNSTNSSRVGSVFEGCAYLKKLPEISQWKPQVMSKLFSGCSTITEVTDEWVNSINWSAIENLTSLYTYEANHMFYKCHSLRKFPVGMIHFPKVSTSYYAHPYYYMACYCYRLDEVVNLPVDPNPITDGNACISMLSNCSHLKNFTFAPYEGTVNWKNLTIDLTTYVGYGRSWYHLADYHYPNPMYGKAITADNYQDLKDDPDAYATTPEYSRYNHDSAVRTINSLPTTTGTGCTIIFEGNNGLNTDGGAINTLTEAEIAVAAAKGWTVSIR